MTVVFRAGEQTFKASEVLWAKRELVNAIVEQALISQTEAFIDMIVDGQEDLSRAAINDTLRGVKESTQEFLNDLVGDLQFALEARLFLNKQYPSTCGGKPLLHEENKVLIIVLK